MSPDVASTLSGFGSLGLASAFQAGKNDSGVNISNTQEIKTTENLKTLLFSMMAPFDIAEVTL